MIFTKHYDMSVAEAARARIRNLLLHNKCMLSFSGGKESLVMAHMAYDLISKGEAPAENLEVLFIDEEAIYPCVERIVRLWRDRFTSLGVRFLWVCSEFRHFSCFNALYNDESFITFDETKRDVWVRPKEPGHVVFDNPLRLSYQAWLDRYITDRVQIIGLRARESIQRRLVIARNKDPRRAHKAYPLHDWTLNDVWLYIRDNNIDFPDAYLYMYKLGIHSNHLRISQFFSIDTAISLVRMCEFYPGLFERI
ncbi:MAG: phosphoadenosine phosphosulfate reductase family protein, partial [Leptospiraceae bacterium]|nr:phosphoadenosine phosphosulfate reductase family protein [Leptospiraceae bacterium]